jgi:hypothetical protein
MELTNATPFQGKGTKAVQFIQRYRSKVYMNINVSILAEIPEVLHESLKSYLESHPDWDQDRVYTAALSLFLMQNGNCDRRAARVYLDALFRYSI